MFDLDKKLTEFIDEVNKPNYSLRCEQCATAPRILRQHLPWESKPRVVAILVNRKKGS